MADVNRAKDPAQVGKYYEHIEAMPGEDGFDPKKLVDKIERRTKKFAGELQEVFNSYQANRKYYRGEQINTNDLYVNETPIVINRIFSGIETIVPVAVKNTPEANVRVKPVEKRTLNIKSKVERELKDQWEIKQSMPIKMRKALRQWAMSGFWCVKVVWDKDTDEQKWILMPPGKVLFPMTAASEDEMPCVIEYVKSTFGEMRALFPDMEDELRTALGDRDLSDDTEVTYVEYWEDGYYACKYGEVLLHAERNPNFNYEDSGFLDENGKPINHLSKPKKPYVFGNVYNLGESVVDDLVLVGASRSIQDGINKRKRQIEVNADMANGQWIVAGKAMGKEGLEDLRNNPTGIIYLNDADNTNGAIEKISGQAFAQGTYEDMQDSKNELDAMYGTNSNLRGERESQETATGRQILKQSDTDRIGGSISVAIEDFASRIYDLGIQMIYTWYEEKRYIMSLPEGRDYELSAIDKENFIDRQEFKKLKLSVLVNSGSTIPQDKNVIRAEAVDLAKSGLMSLIDMYRTLEYPNPDKLAFNATMEKKDPLSIYGGLIEPEGYSVDAIQHLLAIQKGESDGQDNLFDGQTPEEWNAHIKTNANYMKGVELDDDLITMQSLDIETQVAIIAHIRQENIAMQQFMATQPLPPVAPATDQELAAQQAPQASAPTAVGQAGLDPNAMAGQPPALPTEQPVSALPVA